MSDPTNGYAIHYSKFRSIDLTTNPNLLIFCAYSLNNEAANSQLKLLKVFARYCNNLAQYARKKLL
jgi:hypothetical protein